MISIQMNLKTFESRYFKIYIPGKLILAKQYTNSVFNSKVFVRGATYKSSNYKPLSSTVKARY
ncbi:hypothetical protein EV142_106344 [Flavobacterium circumlabens]|uniref:DUF4236 domain-containing protein n=1 Tax=Flavobacterium circumlabens TaxID=2133765 RepID=A0ABY2AXP2_9FLAO|nr:hypothetical protein EV142_106344 [Flavobacterium circumlabens]